jgi:transcriptional regulator with XRE-family HTH domain
MFPPNNDVDILSILIVCQWEYIYLYYFAIMEMMEFKDWINKKFVEWRGDTRLGVTDFAKYLGISQPTMSSWMSGVIPKAPHNIEKLAEKYGDEIYSYGIPRVDLPMSSFPTPIRRRLRAAQKEIEVSFRERGLTGEMPEAERLTIEIMEKYGFKYTGTEEVPDT